MSPLEVTEHLLLLALFEGGNEIWSTHYRQYGASEFLDRIRAGQYAENKRGGKSLQEALASLNGERLFEELESIGAFLISREDSDWPASLEDLKAPPIALIGRGNREALENAENSIAIVGTRNPSDYGSRIAGDFAAGVVDRGWSVVSGGAYGIDSAAHRGATCCRRGDHRNPWLVELTQFSLVEMIDSFVRFSKAVCCSRRYCRMCTPYLPGF